ncbi:hypothetical protein Tco_1554975 [Tanacetum coccineum]
MLVVLPEHQSDTQVITVKMEILLEPTSNKLLVDPYRFEGYLKMEVKVFKITFSHSSQAKGTSSSLKSMITTSIHKLMIEVKDYELKTKVKA